MDNNYFPDIVGKLHEISFYGLLTTIVLLLTKQVTFQQLLTYGFHPSGFLGIFEAYLFWASVLFLPIAITGAFATKYLDLGTGLSFESDNIFVILFAHIAEEILGLVMAPFWFLKQLFTHDLDAGRIIDYITLLIEVVFIAAGVLKVLRII